MGLPHLLCMSQAAYWDHVLLHTQMQVAKMLILTVRIILEVMLWLTLWNQCLLFKSDTWNAGRKLIILKNVCNKLDCIPNQFFIEFVCIFKLFLLQNFSWTDYKICKHKNTGGINLLGFNIELTSVLQMHIPLQKCLFQ